MAREDAHTMRCRLRGVACSFDSLITGALPTASSPEWGLAGPKEEVARVVPLVLSKDKTASRGSKRWRELFYRVGRVAGIAEPGSSPVLMGRTLAALVEHDRDACAAALEHGLAARAVRFLWEGLLHAIKVTLSCSWSMLLQVVALSRPLLRLYRTAEGLSSGQLVSKVKVRVAAGKAHTLLLETTFRGKPGVAFDARKWFEGLMSNPTIRAAIMIPGLGLLVALSLDAYYNFGHFDEKEAVEHVLTHAEVKKLMAVMA
jgi:hypothetical protein